MPNEPTLIIRFDENQGVLRLAGTLGVQQIGQMVEEFERHQGGDVRLLDLTELDQLDTSGAMLLRQWAGDLPVRYADAAQREMLEALGPLTEALPSPPPPHSLFKGNTIALGRATVSMLTQLDELVRFVGQAFVMLARAVRHPQHLRAASIGYYINQVGIKALPIIGLMAFLISIVLAYQGVQQLKPYGGEQFTVNLVAISILREMGVLLTAIMVAGRSGSAFTAEIGVMKSREEVDALQVMGFDAFDLLVLPRLIAIMIALPLLAFFADMMGLLGGYLIIHSLIDITLVQYIQQLHQAAHWNDLLVGILKAPIFAFFIGIVGCMHGLRVSGSAESVGFETTEAVVKSIFLVLVVDAFFSIFFSMVKL
ncbi:MAG: MlaE family ABC transporter permease [Rickettsiales bacterium]